MSDNWFFLRNGERFGPHSSQQIKQYADSGQIRPQDYVWKEGMDDWALASTIKGLFIEGKTGASTNPEMPPPFRDPSSSRQDYAIQRKSQREISVRVQAPKTHPLGTAAKWITLGWTGFCLLGVVVGMLSAADSIANDPYARYSEAAQAGQILGVGIGLFIWLTIWAVISIPSLVVWLLMRK